MIVDFFIHVSKHTPRRDRDLLSHIICLVLRHLDKRCLVEVGIIPYAGDGRVLKTATPRCHPRVCELFHLCLNMFLLFFKKELTGRVFSKHHDRHST